MNQYVAPLFHDGPAGNTPLTAAVENAMAQGVQNEDVTNTASPAHAFLFWTPGTAYVAGQQVISPTGDVVAAKTSHTSGTTFSGTGPSGNWLISSRKPTPLGAICFVWDDGFASHDTIATMATQRGQLHSFGIVSSFMQGTNPLYANSAQVLSWSNQGHEIVCHTKTHPNLATTSDLPTRVSEYDDSKAAIEAVIGAGKITTFMYPYGARSTLTDNELYGRYDRLLATFPYYPTLLDSAEREDDFVIRRVTWNGDPNNQQDVLARIRECATKPVILVTQGHDIGGGAPNPSPSLAQITEAMNLAQSLGIPCITVSQAFPPATRLVNGGFENQLNGIPVEWQVNVSDSNQVVESIADTPAPGLNGTQSLHLKSTADSGTYAYGRQTISLKPNTSYTLTGQYRTAIASGGGGFNARVQEYSYEDAVSGLITTDQLGSGTLASSTWAPFVLNFTTSPNTRYGYLDFVLQNATGEAWVDHVDLRPSRNGAFGSVQNTAIVYGGYVRAWQPSMVYQAGQQVISPNGDVVSAKAAFVSGATYNAANWNLSTSFAPSANVQVFTASGTWTKPAGCTSVTVSMLGGGGGGGAGATAASGTYANGGGGGGGAGWTYVELPASAVGATETVTVGAAGAGAPANSGTSTAGATGTSGGISSFGTHAQALQGGKGGGGTVGGAAAGGGSNGGGTNNGAAGAASNATGGAGNAANSTNGAPGAGSGGGVSTAGVFSAGGSGSSSTTTVFASPVGGATAGANGAAGTAVPATSPRPGAAGGGGASNPTGNAGSGGAAGNYGAGGGGGGAALNGFTAGGGGAGGAGIVVVVAHF